MYNVLLKQLIERGDSNKLDDKRDEIVSMQSKMTLCNLSEIELGQGRSKNAELLIIEMHGKIKNIITLFQQGNLFHNLQQIYLASNFFINSGWYIIIGTEKSTPVTLSSLSPKITTKIRMRKFRILMIPQNAIQFHSKITISTFLTILFNFRKMLWSRN